MRRLLFLVGAIVFVDTMFYVALTPLLPDYADDLGLSKTGAGVLAASYAAGALFGAIPGGMAAARWGVRPTVLIGLAGMSVTTFVFGFAEHIVLLDAARFIQGFASAFSWTGGLAWLVAAAPRGPPRGADRSRHGNRDRGRAVRARCSAGSRASSAPAGPSAPSRWPASASPSGRR